jgi:exonuclease III
MILVKKSRNVHEMHTEGKEQVEILAMEMDTSEGGVIIAVVYMPPKTSTRNLEEYNELADDTIHSMDRLLEKVEDKNKKIILTGDFNSSINWGTPGIGSRRAYIEQ